MQESATPRSVPLLEVRRGTLVESLHRGFIAAINAEGELIGSLGDITTPTYYRSAAKPFQAIPLIATGAADHFKLTPRELAVIIGSHSGEAMHVETVAAILSKIGLDETALQCGSHTPFDKATAWMLKSEGKAPTVLHHNCSGKHAGMLALAQFLGESIENYLDPNHPVQVRIRQVLARFADVSIDEITIAIDGCSAPVFGLPIKAMAHSYARLVGWQHTNIEDALGTAAQRVVNAMKECPEMVGGTNERLDTDLMRVAQGRIISKVGAEGVHLLGVLPEARYPSGLGIAIKIEDGDTRRARDPVVIEVLRQLALLDEKHLRSLRLRASWCNHTHLNLKGDPQCLLLVLDLRRLHKRQI